MNDYRKMDMNLLIVVLFDDTYLDDVILGIMSVSGGKITIIDALSGTENLTQAIPMFAKFAGIGGKQFCKVLISAVSGGAPAHDFIEGLKLSGLDFVGSSMGEIYVMKLSEAVLVDEVDL